MDQIAEECIALIAAAKQLPAEQVTLDSTFEDLAVDSLDRVSLSFDVEEKYGIEIPDSRLHTILTVRDMVEGVEEALRAKVEKARLKEAGEGA
ncbi:phosphopantetheine-binding protein [Terriglobus saanensis SP1PR4]|uniref:Acyl carrier protein n=2 Tax=Terriglobus saanensis TaxID=870903 RepID=E8V2B4_TERSS|nr:phosphopantetheine-binding protein [Terriglobus saanensis SP1PR4]